VANDLDFVVVIEVNKVEWVSDVDNNLLVIKDLAI
jgi:hypothetical protein